uniref:DRBM domain-containing protein n=1 Tax=Ananas comosus var. bracteatus TaxID=296719 RepID=A0A6V7P4C0_ANACO|nr:unnamed protein product [Ananas comosus var. bracteatus]
MVSSTEAEQQQQQQALGFKRKSESLKEIMRPARKKEPQFVVKGQQPLAAGVGVDKLAKLFVDSKETHCESHLHKTKDKDKTVVGHQAANEGQQANPSGQKGIPRIKTARTKLFEICASNYWKAPLFELCQEGPVHGRMFTCKVTMEVDTITTTILECFSEPKRKKKAAREHAAEGALWYLEHLGTVVP